MGSIKGKRILDFGSGTGFTANYLAQDNEVVAIELSEETVKDRYCDYEYKQIVGSIDILKKLENETFDIILCHNVLEYADGREEIVNEFYRLLKRCSFFSSYDFKEIIALNDYRYLTISSKCKLEAKYIWRRK